MWLSVVVVLPSAAVVKKNLSQKETNLYVTVVWFIPELQITDQQPVSLEQQVQVS